MQIPLIVGVTGHRDLVPAEIPVLKEEVRRFFNTIRETFPELPILLLDPMADGADQLVAEVAIELDIPVDAVLPMPVDEYRMDFEGEALQRFEQLLAKSEIVELPFLKSSGEIDRDEQYVAVGGYVVAHCHILLTLWDGKDFGSRGGTSRVVRFHQHETMEFAAKDDLLTAIDFDEDESDLVYHIACSRVSGGAPESGLAPADASWVTRADVSPRTKKMPERYRTVFRRMIEYNRDGMGVDHESDDLTDNRDAVRSAVLEQTSQQYCVADNLAQRFQKLTNMAIRLGHLFIVIAGLSFIVYADLYSQDVMIYCYLIAVSMVFGVFYLESRQQWQLKYLDYRMLAEALRVQFYWTLAGVKMKRPHHFSHDSFRGRKELDLGWIRNVMRFTSRKSDAQLGRASEELVELVLDDWVGIEQGGQRAYYGRKSSEAERKNKVTSLLEAISFLIVMLIALVLVFQSSDFEYANILILMVGVLPFMVAVRKSYAHRTAEKELISQYGYYYRLFTNASRLISQANKVDTKRAILRALGEAALDESSQWLLRQKERPVGSASVFGG